MFLHTKHLITRGLRKKVNCVIILVFSCDTPNTASLNYVSNYQRMSVYSEYSRLLSLSRSVLQKWIDFQKRYITYYIQIY